MIKDVYEMADIMRRVFPPQPLLWDICWKYDPYEDCGCIFAYGEVDEECLGCALNAAFKELEAGKLAGIQPENFLWEWGWMPYGETIYENVTPIWPTTSTDG